MATWGCGLPVGCSQPAVAGGVIYADLKSELSTHLASQALFTQSSPGPDHHCYKLSPFQAHWGRWHCTCFLRPACLFTVHVGSGSSPLSCGVFLPTPLLQAFPLLVAGCVPPLLPSPAGLWGISPPPLLQHSGSPALFATCLFCCYCLLLCFSFFPGWGSVCPGGYADLAQGCLWEYRIPLSSPCGRRLPKLSGCWHLAAAGSPPGFSI
jgi:hypothetical protein